MITTGSTQDLKARRWGLPTVVFCHLWWRGEPAGIVATRLDPNEVISLRSRFDDPDFTARIDSFVDLVAGPKEGEQFWREAGRASC